MDRTATDQHIFDVDYGRRRPANRTVRRGGGSAGKFLDKTASDLHGSKGMADDLTLGHDFKRLAMIDAMLGDTDHPVAAFAALADAA